MPVSLPRPRHIVEKSDNLVRITLVSKKNIIRVLWFCLWLFGWGYMVYGFIVIAIAFNKAIEAGKNLPPQAQPGGIVVFLGIFFLIFFLALLALGAFGIQRLIWLIAGKEVVETDSKVLKISRQAFVWKSTQEYLVSEVKDLRVVAKQSSFSPGRNIHRLLGSNIMVAFDYGAKTFRFGSELEEAEAKQIVLALKERLPQQNAG